MPEFAVAYVGLGSNLDDPGRQLERAFGALSRIEHSRLLARSSIYSSPPMGPPDQPHYLNAVAALRTALPPLALLTALQRIETAQGRVRTLKWGPRTLDLDLLSYADQVMDSDLLTLPHPGLAARAFVLYPLAEIAPDLVVPGAGKVSAMVRACPAAGLERLPEPTMDVRAVGAGDDV